MMASKAASSFEDLFSTEREVDRRRDENEGDAAELDPQIANVVRQAVEGSVGQSVDPGFQQPNDPTVRFAQAGPSESAASEAIHTAEAKEAVSEELAVRVQTRTPHIEPLSPEDLALRVEVFVPPPGYVAATEATGTPASARIVIFSGPESSGRLTCAVNWARSHCATAYRSGFRSYGRHPDETSSLLEVVGRDEWSVETVVLLENAFDHDGLLAELEGSRLGQLMARLESKRSFLLLTTVMSARQLRRVGALKIDVSALNLDTVLEKHVRFYAAERGGNAAEAIAARILASSPTVLQHLTSPSLIEQFCREIVSQGGNEPDLVRVARELAAIDPERLRSWFHSLSTNERLFGLLAFLFQGVEHAALLEIYRRAAMALRDSGFSLARDARAAGYFDLAETLRLQAGGRTVQILDEPTRQELSRQCVNRQLMLWSALLPLVEQFAQTGSWIDGCPASFLGLAIGRLGLGDTRKLAEILGSLAQAASRPPAGRRIASLPGTALAQLLVLEPQGSWLEIWRILRSWAGSTQRELLWAAGAALWRVFRQACHRPSSEETTARELRESLLELAGFLVQRPSAFDIMMRLALEAKLRAPDADSKALGKMVGGAHWRLRRELSSCVAFALVEMGKDDRAAVCDLLRDWIAKPKGSILRGAALNSCEKSFDALKSEATEEGLATNRAIFTLVGPVLTAVGAHRDVTAAMMGALRAWLKWPDWHDAIFAELLAVANFADSKTRESLRQALSRYWLPGGEVTAVAMAQKVIARCQAMDGVMADHPFDGSAVLAVDPSFFVEDLPANPSREDVLSKRRGAAWHLAALLEAQRPLSVVRLGERGAQVGSASPSALVLETPIENHRLLLPGLESAPRQGLRLLVVLTTGEIADLDDALAGGGAKQVLVISAGAELPLREGAEIMNLGRELEADDLAKVEAWLEARWAESLVEATPASWRPVLKSFGLEALDPRDPEPLLAVRAAELPNTEQATGHEDLARGLLVALLFLAATDLSRTIEFLRRWLEADPEASPERKARRAIAAAGAHALLRLHSSRIPLPEAQAAELLFNGLAEPLARWHADGAAAVLAAVERWLEDPKLAAFFAGDIRMGRGCLLRWAEAHLPEQVDTLRAALENLQRVAGSEDLGALSSALAGALDRIDFAIKTGPVQPLPRLAPGERYGLIVIDAGATDDLLAELAVNLAAELDREREHGIKPALYRLGERAPAWVPGNEPGERVRLSLTGYRLPPVLGPVLDGELAPRDVAFVLVLAHTRILDAEDWLETEWFSRLFSYPPAPRYDPGRHWLSVPIVASQDGARDLARYLVEQSRRSQKDSSAPPTPPDPATAQPSA